ncbi:hypothetical protein SSS_05691 [Sarcoptes scabiei]|nr:hypothetical protein SSS_05691 [Sarcoptes scabiei]
MERFLSINAKVLAHGSNLIFITFFWHFFFKAIVRQDLEEIAIRNGQDLSRKYAYKDQAWYGTTKRSRDATLSKFAGLKLEELLLQQKIAKSPSGETWRGIWQRNKTEICAKFLAVSGEMSSRIPRDFAEEYPRLRIFSHPNVLPVIGCVNSPPNLIVVNQLMPYGSLFKVLHEGSPIVVDSHRALQFAIDIARGMSFLHTLNPLIPRFYLSSKHVMIDEDLTAKVNMADAKFSFQEKNKSYNPGWMSPEALQKKHTEINVAKSDMWSFAILLWELATRQVPFAEYSPMETGMKIALEALRVSIPPGISPQMARLIKICMNEDPGKRPSFDQIIPILEKMRLS